MKDSGLDNLWWRRSRARAWVCRRDLSSEGGAPEARAWLVSPKAHRARSEVSGDPLPLAVGQYGDWRRGSEAPEDKSRLREATWGYFVLREAEQDIRC